VARQMVDASKMRPDLSYMTLEEARLFQQMSQSGRITIFRQKKCEGRRETDDGWVECEQLIYYTKQYCGVDCFHSKEPINESADGDESPGSSETGDHG
jgi:hypothetical protein